MLNLFRVAKRLRQIGLMGLGRHYQILTTTHGVAQRDPDGWLATAPQHDGSWWPAWVDWLWNRSGVSTAAPQISDDASADAPGTYALQR